MLNSLLGELLGPDMAIVLLVVLVLFGGSQLPKLARGLGSAQREFKKGLEEGADDTTTRTRRSPTDLRAHAGPRPRARLTA